MRERMEAVQQTAAEASSGVNRMKERGWVYVITNEAMPGLVKVGYSTRDPHDRAQELNHTGSPKPFRVSHDVLVLEPQKVEQAVHKELEHLSHGKEWFKTSVERASNAIREVAHELDAVLMDEQVSSVLQEKIRNFRRGWVYIIYNESMPDLVKIGYSTKDPNFRALELDHTGSPTPYIVVYDILVVDAYEVEQAVHRELEEKRYGKEWFKTSIGRAVQTITDVTRRMGNVVRDVNDGPDLQESFRALFSRDKPQERREGETHQHYIRRISFDQCASCLEYRTPPSSDENAWTCVECGAVNRLGP
jgi:T5orf172 domain-containing protein